MYGLSDAQHRASRRLIWYVRAQQSVTVIVLLPGMDGTGTLSAEFVTALQPEVEALVVSYPNDPALGYTELERIARSWLPATRPFLILGESFSGPIAVSIAATQPPGLVGVVLCGSFVRNPSPSLASSIQRCWRLRPIGCHKLVPPRPVLHRSLTVRSRTCLGASVRGNVTHPARGGTRRRRIGAARQAARAGALSACDRRSDRPCSGVSACSAVAAFG